MSDRNALTKGSDKSTKQQDKGQGPEEVNTQSGEAPQKENQTEEGPSTRKWPLYVRLIWWRRRGMGMSSHLVNFHLSILIEITLVIHPAVVFGQLHTQDDRRDKEKQAPADCQPETVLQARKLIF